MVLSLRAIAASIRFQQHPEFTACWVWTGSVEGAYQHAVAFVDGGKVSARRAVYQVYRGEPQGRLYSRCRVKLCVNPSHVEVKVKP